MNRRQFLVQSAVAFPFPAFPASVIEPSKNVEIDIEEYPGSFDHHIFGSDCQMFAIGSGKTHMRLNSMWSEIQSMPVRAKQKPKPYYRRFEKKPSFRV